MVTEWIRFCLANMRIWTEVLIITCSYQFYNNQTSVAEILENMVDATVKKIRVYEIYYNFINSSIPVLFYMACVLHPI